jgi:hypothetical protein
MMTETLGQKLHRYHLVAAVVLMTAMMCAPSASFGQTAIAQSGEAQIVTLMTDPARPNAPCDGTEQLINAVINPADGSLSPFVIPPGAVFVLTGGTWSQDGGTPRSSSRILVVLRPDEKHANTMLLGPSVSASDAGFAAGAFTLQPGIAFKPGASICVEVDSDGKPLIGFPRPSGFLRKSAKEKSQAN